MSVANESLPKASIKLPGGSAIWVFIIGDMAMFAAFFGQFIYDRASQVELFNQSSAQLSITFGAINTLILLTGSLFVVLGVDAIKRANNQKASRQFIFALLCAATFGANKLFEYGSKVGEGIYPYTNDFFMYYYLFTGIHALHLVIGIFFLLHMLRLSRKVDCCAEDIGFIDCGASYWHLVDLLWVVLFAILYLLT